MVLVHRQWEWGTRGHENPWAEHFTSGETTDNSFTEHFATTPSETSTHNPTTLVPAAAAQTTDSSSQAQTSTEPAEVQTTANTMPTTSPTSSPLSVGGEPTLHSTSQSEATQSSGMSTSGVVPSLSGGLTVSLPDTASADQSTASGSSSTAQPVATGSNGHPTSSNSGHGIGKGAIAAIALGVVFAIGLGAFVYYCWKRRGVRRRNSTFIQYPFSSDAATGRMPAVPHAGALVPPNTPADWETMAESPSATLTFASPTAAGALGYGYGGGRATYPLDEKSPLPSPSDNNPFDPATAPSPRSATAFALSFPMPPSPLSQSPASPELSSSLVVPPPPAAHPSLPEGEPSAMPYAWDRPPPSSEYLPPRTPDRRSTFRSSRTGSGPSPRRASAATPIYSSGVPEVDRRPPSYSRY